MGTSLGVNALFDQDQESYSAFTALTWNVNACNGALILACVIKRRKSEQRTKCV
ncbi:hypothetical protein ACOBV9_22550 (plasmid) [Pseudoalteromonas espejiana]